MPVETCLPAEGVMPSLKVYRVRLMRSFLIAVSTALLVLVTCCQAQEKQADKQPRIFVASPLAIAPGVPVKLCLRGLYLDEITDLKLVSLETKAEIVSKGKATVPQNYEPKRIGDTQAEVKFTLAAETSPGPLRLIATTAMGTSEPYEILVAKGDDLIEEKEPNDSFKTAQQIAIGKTVAGTIHDPRNVDVFQFNGEAGQKLEIRVQAAGRGSPLDPFLTLYNQAGQILAGADDTDGRDPRLNIVFDSTGSYFITLQDANDAGGVHFAYLLNVAVKE